MKNASFAFLEQSAQQAFAQVCVAALSLLASVCFARTLSPATLGTFTVANACFWLVLLGAGMGTPTLLGRRLGQQVGRMRGALASYAADTDAGTKTAGKARRRLPTELLAPALAQTLRLSCALGAVAAAVLMLGRLPHAGALALAAVPALAVQLLGAVALASGRLGLFRLLQWLPVLVVALLAGLARTLALPTLVWWALAAGQSIAAAVGFWHLGSRVRARPRTASLARALVARGGRNKTRVASYPRKSLWRRAIRRDFALLRAGLPVVAGQLLVNVGLRIDILVLGQVLPMATVACYAIAKQLSERLNIVAQATGPLAFAAAAAGANNTALACRAGALVSLLGACALAALAPFLVPLIFGAAYKSAVPLLWWLVVGQAFANVGQIVAGDLLARGRATTVLRCCALGTTTLCLALYAWVPHWGIAGAAAASTMAACLEATAKVMAFARLTSTPWRAILQLHGEDKALVCALWQRAWRRKRRWA